MSMMQSIAHGNTMSYLMGSDTKLYEPFKMFKTIGYLSALTASALMVWVTNKLCIVVGSLPVATYSSEGEILGNIVLLLGAIFITLYFGKRMGSYLIWSYLIEVLHELYRYQRRSNLVTVGYMIYDGVIDSKIELVEILAEEYDKLC